MYARFQSHWSAKEAATKALGVGLGLEPLSELQFEFTYLDEVVLVGERESEREGDHHASSKREIETSHGSLTLLPDEDVHANVFALSIRDLIAKHVT